MFGKAVVLSVWGIGAAAYKSFKEKRRANGVVLEYDARRGVYYDPIVRFEKRVKIGLWIVGVPFALYTAFIFFLLIGPPLMAKLAG